MKQTELNIYKYIDENGHSVYTNTPIEGLSVIFHNIKTQIIADENNILSSIIDGTTTELALVDNTDQISTYVEVPLEEAVKINEQLSSYIEKFRNIE